MNRERGGGAGAELRLNNEDNFLLRLLTSLMNLRGCSRASEQEPNSAHLLDMTPRVVTGRGCDAVTCHLCSGRNLVIQQLCVSCVAII